MRAAAEPVRRSRGPSGRVPGAGPPPLVAAAMRPFHAGQFDLLDADDQRMKGQERMRAPAGRGARPADADAKGQRSITSAWCASTVVTMTVSKRVARTISSRPVPVGASVPG